MAADAIEHSGLEVATLDKSITDELAKSLPAAASVANPIDVLGDAQADRYAAAVAAAQQDGGVDAIVVILTPQAMTQMVETAQAISENRGSKPMLVTFMGGKDVMPGREELLELGIPEYPSPERAVAALSAMCEYTEWKEMPPRVVARFPVNRRRAERVLHRCTRTGQFQVGEAAAKDVMRAYNFNVPPGRIAATADDAVDLAVKIGLPVAMKIVSPDIVHKSDLGGVKLNLSPPDEVRDAFDLMMLRIGKKMPDANLNGAYIEKMCGRGREVILGMTRDPQFGPMLMFGLGGIFVEIMKDVTFHLAPITAQEALEMLRNTKSYALLEGARGRSRVDIDAIASCLQRLSQLVTDFPQIAEMDINPLIVGEVGTDPVVADARITLPNAQ
jgi:acetyltransferase